MYDRLFGIKHWRMVANSSAMLIDSHSHKESGAIIAYSQQGHVEALAEWLISMMQENWDCSLTIASIVRVHFK